MQNSPFFGLSAKSARGGIDVERRRTFFDRDFSLNAGRAPCSDRPHFFIEFETPGG